MPQFAIRDTGDLRRLSKNLRQAADGKELRKELTNGLRAELLPVATAVEAAYASAPSRGHATSSRARQAQPSLRTLLARATQVQVRIGGRDPRVGVAVKGKRMPSGMRALPRYWEGTKPRWRHPVFGDREVWVDQPARPIFDRTVEPFERPLRLQAIQIINRVNRKALRGGL